MKIARRAMSFVLSMLAIASCVSGQSVSETLVTTTIESVETVTSNVATTVVVTTGSSSVTTTVVANATNQPSSNTTSATNPSTTSATNPSTTSASVAKVAPPTTVAASRPKLSVSQTNNLDSNGTSVTVRGSGYDVNKGVYVIVCTQAAPGPQATCIGGVNLDGSAPSSVWVSSNPPNYAVGLTTPFSPDGSFSVELLVIAKSGALDCTVLKCGVVTRSDHLRYADRTQDVFVPISFAS